MTQFSTTDGGRNLKLQGWMLGSPKNPRQCRLVFYPKGHQLLVVENSKIFVINSGVSCFFWLFLYGKCLLQTFGTCSEKKHHRVVSQRCRAVDHLQLSPFKMSFVSVQPKGHQLFPPSNHISWGCHRMSI